VQKDLTTAACPFIIGVQDSRDIMKHLLRRLWHDEQGQDIAEYAVMLAVILLLVVGTIKLIGTNANSTFSNVASTIQ
jgi:Flp pilus assembly pilin Flp